MASYELTPTQHLVSPNIDSWTALFPLVQSKQPRILEIGSCDGRSAAFLLNTLCKDGGEIICIDHFDLLKTEAGRQRFDQVNHALTGKQSRVLAQFSVPGLMTVLKEEITSKNPGFDWIYVDGSHEADDTMLNGELVWRLAKKGAIIIFDDYHWDREREDSIHHPRKGIDAFLTVHVGEYERLTEEEHYQVVLRKLTDMRIGFQVGGADDQKLVDDAHGSTINIVLCFDSPFAMAGAVLIRSIVENTPERLTIYIVDCEILPEDKEKLKQTIDGFDQATLIFVPLPDDSLGKQMGALWARLDMIEILPVERVIYLDADVLVRRGLKPLWEADLEGKPLAAVPDVGHLMFRNIVDTKAYFNSGVLVMDLPKVRLDVKGLKELIAHISFIHDQAALNVFYKQRWTPLSLAWNAHPLATYKNYPAADQKRHSMEQMADPNIAHFTGPVHSTMLEILDPNDQPPRAKPWGYRGSPGHPYESEWWAVLERTPWKGIRSTEKWNSDNAKAMDEAIAIATDKFRKLVAARK